MACSKAEGSEVNSESHNPAVKRECAKARASLLLRYAQANEH